jgi:hypothetical protein
MAYNRMLQNNPELKSKIDQLWNKFWSGGISNPLTAIEQITYLLFMKRLDELDQKKLADADWTGETYASKFDGQWIPPEYRKAGKAPAIRGMIDSAACAGASSSACRPRRCSSMSRARFFPSSRT